MKIRPDFIREQVAKEPLKVRSAPLKDDRLHLISLLDEVVRSQPDGEQVWKKVEELRQVCKFEEYDPFNPHNNDPEKVEARFQEMFDKAEELVLKSPELYEGTVRTYELYFQLTNLSEQMHRLRRCDEYRKEYEESGRKSSYAPPGSLVEGVYKLKDQGVDLDGLLDRAKRTKIVDVLTAHPTEANKPETLARLDHIREFMEKRASANTETEKQVHDTSIKAELESLWDLTPVRDQKPQVIDEVQAVQRSLIHVILPALPEVVTELQEAIFDVYGVEVPYEPLAEMFEEAMWAGGDADNHPFVTPEVTAKTIASNREEVCNLHIKGMRKLLNHAANDLHDDIENIIDKLEHSKSEDKAKGYSNADEFHDDLKKLETVLLEKSPNVCKQYLKPVRIIAIVAGLHLAELDLRQDQGAFEKALDLNPQLKINGKNYGELKEEERVSFLQDVLTGDKEIPMMEGDMPPEVAHCYNIFTTLKESQDKFGPESCNKMVLSMALQPSDIMMILAFAKQQGLIWQDDHGKWQGEFTAMPLFETPEALRNSHKTLEALFSNEVVREIIGDTFYCMFGFSDSARIGGMIASPWEIYKAKCECYKVAEKYGIELRIFNGPGGAIGRGNSMAAHDGIKAEPPQVLNYKLRMTEQGEVVGKKHGNVRISKRSRALTLGAVWLASNQEGTDLDSLPVKLRQDMDAISRLSEERYQGIVFDYDPSVTSAAKSEIQDGDRPYSMYFSSVAPLDFMKRLKHASRPDARGSTGEGQIKVPFTVDKSRAIPKNTGGHQTRNHPVSYVGVGRIDHYLWDQADPNIASPDKDVAIRETVLRLRDGIQRYPIIRSIIDNIEMGMSKVRLPIARIYQQQLFPGQLGDVMHKTLEAEYLAAFDSIMTITGHNKLLESNETLAFSVEGRDPYANALNVAQAAGVKHLRDGIPDPEGRLDRGVRNSVQAIAAAMFAYG